MVTKEQILETLSIADEAAKPIREEKTKMLQDIEIRLEVIYNPLFRLLDIYNDENLIDKNGQAIRIGDVITDGKNLYKVENRGMQTVFGNLLFNPRVLCKKTDKSGFIAPKAIVRSIHPTELKNFWIV